MWTRTLSTTISTSPFRARGSSLAMRRLSHAEPVRPGVARPTPSDRAHDGAHDHAGDEAADVGEDRDARVDRRARAERHEPAQQLEPEPEHEDDQGRHV